MAKRKSRKNMRRRRSRGFNVVNAAELYLTTDVLTRNFMGTNPIGFFTGQEMGTVTSVMTGTNQKTGQPFSYGVQQSALGYYPQAVSVTLPELLGFDKNNLSVPVGGINGLAIIKTNFKENAIPAAIQYAGVKIGFKVAKKLLSKQRSFINKSILEPLGMKSTVVV